MTPNEVDAVLTKRENVIDENDLGDLITELKAVQDLREGRKRYI